MYFEDVILDAIEQVLEWDVPEAVLGRVAMDRAVELAKLKPDQLWIGEQASWT